VEIEGFKIREFRAQDEEEILRLFRESYGKEKSADLWRWEFAENPAGSVVLVAESGGRIAGSLAAVLKPFVFDGEEVVAAHSVDTMVAPEWRGKGLYKTLSSKFIGILKKKKVRVVYGFANRNSRSGVVKYQGRREIGFPLHVLPVSPAGIFRFALKKTPPLLQESIFSFEKLIRKTGASLLGLDNDPFGDADEFGEEYTKFFESVKEDFSLWVKRDADYLNHRYRGKPGASYKIHVARGEKGELAGFAVVRGQEYKGLKTLFVMELVAESREYVETMSKLLKGVTSHAVGGDYDIVSLLMFPSSPFSKELPFKGFMPVPENLFPQEISFSARVLDPDGDDPVLYSQGAWHISWGDTDLL